MSIVAARNIYSREGVLCGMRKFEKVYFAEFHFRNVSQITLFSAFFLHSAKFR